MKFLTWDNKRRFICGCFLAGISLATVVACSPRNYEICNTDNCSTTNLMVTE